MEVVEHAPSLIARSPHTDAGGREAARERFRTVSSATAGSVDTKLPEPGPETLTLNAASPSIGILPQGIPGQRRTQQVRSNAKCREMSGCELRQFRAIERVTDASALLWKLDLLGVDVGVRWQLVADQWERAGPLGDYARDAWMAMMAFVGTGREVSQRQTLITLKVISLGWGESAFFAKEFGMAAAQAILAFGAGRYAETVDLLRPLRRCAHGFAADDPARRHLVDLTLLEAAMRSGQHEVASAVLAARAWVPESRGDHKHQSH